MTAAVDICNMALGRLRARNKVTTVFPSPEATEEARQCHVYYHPARQAALEAHDWSFASNEASLALYAGDETPERWLYQYAFPSGCLVPREIVKGDPDEDAIPYQVALSSDQTTHLILTDQKDAVLRFTRDIENPTLFTPGFVQALSWALAVDLAMPITGKSEIMDDCSKAYQRALSSAETYASDQVTNRSGRHAAWHRGRT